MYVNCEEKTNFEEEEKFLISKIQSTSETDPVQSKCWQLFAKSLYPQNPTVIHQLYKEAYKEKDLTESSKYFGELIEKHPDSVSEELKSIVEALHSNSESFIKEIFDHLPDDVKYKVMLMATRNAPCIVAHCELMLLFLKQMPYPKLVEHAYNVIDSLLSSEEASKIPIPVNCYRKMLVCDALPLILQMSQSDNKPEFMLKLLQKAVEFYVTCIFKPSTSDFEIINSVNLCSKEPNKNWEPLLKLFETVAIRYRWNNPEMYGSEFNEKSLFQLLSLLKKKNEILKHMTQNNATITEDIPGLAEAFFCLCLTFFYYMDSFARHIFHKNTSNLFEGHSSYFLMEGISVPQNCCLKKLGPEFKHEEKGYLIVSKLAPPEVASDLILSFLAAVECWETMHHPKFSDEFKCICSNIQLDKWPVFEEFYINLLFYGRHYQLALNILLKIRETTSNTDILIKTSLQIASCHYSLKNFKQCLVGLFDTLFLLSSTFSSLGIKPVMDACPDRFLYFMSFDTKEVLLYCISILIKFYKLRLNVVNLHTDLYIGFILVLIQYDLENEYETLNEVIKKIKHYKTFTFPKFFDYIINVIILEEVGALIKYDGGNINLNILPNVADKESTKQVITRGMNKNTTKALYDAIIKQMARWEENVDDLLFNFVRKESKKLLLPLYGLI